MPEESAILTQEDYNDIRALEIPELPRRRDSFMDVAGCSYHENTITKVYSYFLNREKNRIISDIFLETLLELIIQKRGVDPELIFDELCCIREFSTIEGNRIDLVIISAEPSRYTDSPKFHSAIIIENKIFSKLDNDLNDYYNSVEATQKVGVLLTLRPEPIPPEYSANFINITHRQWLSLVQDRGIPSNLAIHEYVYLTDFISNMNYIIENIHMNSDVQFFFEQTSKILKAKQTMDAAQSYIIEQIQVAAGSLGWITDGGSSGYRYIWKKSNEHLYFTIIFDQLLSTTRAFTI